MFTEVLCAGSPKVESCGVWGVGYSVAWRPKPQKPLNPKAPKHAERGLDSRPEPQMPKPLQALNPKS